MIFKTLLTKFETFTDLFLLKLLFSIFILLFAPIQSYLYAILFLIILDTFLGVYSSIKNKNFSSGDFSKIIHKISFYTLAILATRVLEYFFLFEITKLSVIILTFIAITEFISIIENMFILGLPIPDKVMSFLIKQFKLEGLEEFLKKRKRNKEIFRDIDNYICEYIEDIRDWNTKTALRIVVKRWRELLMHLNNLDSDTCDTCATCDPKIKMKILTLLNRMNKNIRVDFEKHNINKESIKGFDGFFSSKQKEIVEELDNILSQDKVRRDLFVLQFSRAVDKVLYEALFRAQRGILPENSDKTR